MIFYIYSFLTIQYKIYILPIFSFIWFLNSLLIYSCILNDDVHNIKSNSEGVLVILEKIATIFEWTYSLYMIIPVKILSIFPGFHCFPPLFCFATICLHHHASKIYHSHKILEAIYFLFIFFASIKGSSKKYLHWKVIQILSSGNMIMRNRIFQYSAVGLWFFLFLGFWILFLVIPTGSCW